jgi:hypothetical protein
VSRGHLTDTELADYRLAIKRNALNTTAAILDETDGNGPETIARVCTRMAVGRAKAEAWLREVATYDRHLGRWVPTP